MNSDVSFRKRAGTPERKTNADGVFGMLKLFATCSALLAVTALPADAAGVPDAESFMMVALVAGLVLVIIVINVLLAVWAYKDAGHRGMKSPGLWVALVALFGAAGLLLYIIARPKASPEDLRE